MEPNLFEGETIERELYEIHLLHERIIEKVLECEEIMNESLKEMPIIQCIGG